MLYVKENLGLESQIVFSAMYVTTGIQGNLEVNLGLYHLHLVWPEFMELQARSRKTVTFC